MSKIITRPTDFWVPSLSAKQMVAFNDFHRFLLLSGPRKSSKCVAGDTLIATPTGPVPISELGTAVSDAFVPISKRVFSVNTDGDLDVWAATASQLYRNPSRKALRISTVAHQIVCSPEHPLFCTVNDLPPSFLPAGVIALLHGSNRIATAMCDTPHAIRHENSVYFSPLHRITDTEADLYDITVEPFHSFIGNGFVNHNSWASCHKIVRHCFDVNDALVLMVSRNIKTAKEGGIWTYLVEKVLPEWIEAGITSYIRPPCQDNQTRTLYLTIRNRWGGTSKVMLNSLDFDDNAEALFKERAFSMVYFSELSKWMKRKVLDVSALCLRRPGIPYGQHQWLADTNPADDGERSWIYQYFWNERLMEDVPDYIKGDEATSRFRKRQGETNVLEIFLQDNPFISQDEIDDVISTHAYDPDLYARYVEGRWIAGSEDGFFSSTFKHAIHILGSVHHPSRSQWEVVMVPENTTEMQVGTDLGDKSSAVTFAYKVLDEKARNEYYIVDEIIVDNDSVSLDSLVEAILKVMDKWEAYVGHAIMWRFSSDTSSFNKKLSARDTEAMLLFQISKGRIRLEPVDKYKGSVNDGIAMIRRMFFENRLFISANCLHTIAMVKSFKPERARGTGVQKVPDNMHTHPFDALRYILLSNEPRDIARRRPQVARAPARIVSM